LRSKHKRGVHDGISFRKLNLNKLIHTGRDCAGSMISIPQNAPRKAQKCVISIARGSLTSNLIQYPPRCRAVVAADMVRVRSLEVKRSSLLDQVFKSASIVLAVRHIDLTTHTGHVCADAMAARKSLQRLLWAWQIRGAKITPEGCVTSAVEGNDTHRCRVQ
jgi:hypothetical protein